MSCCDTVVCLFLFRPCIILFRHTSNLFGLVKITKLSFKCGVFVFLFGFSLSLSISYSVCLSLCLSLLLSLSLFLFHLYHSSSSYLKHDIYHDCLFEYQSICLSLTLFSLPCPSVSLSVRLYVCLSLSVYPFIYLSVCLPIYRFSFFLHLTYITLARYISCILHNMFDCVTVYLGFHLGTDLN